MRKLVAVAALLAATLLPTAAQAQIFVGLRGAYALPWGDVATSSPLKDTVRSQIPLTLDLGLKLGKALAIGAYAGYGAVQPSKSWQDHCDVTGADCSAAEIRIGGQLNLHAATSGTTELWGGVAGGYEEIRFKDSTAYFTEWTYKGYDASLQGGIDFLVSPNFRLGPFASATVGQFSKVVTSAEAGISDKELHGWLQVGLRGMFAN